MLASLALPVAALAVTGAQAQSHIGSATTTYLFSHLSPIINYSPPSIDSSQTTWNVTRQSHRSTTPNATFSYSYWGDGISIFGNSSNITAPDFRPEGVDGPMFFRINQAVGDTIRFILEASGFFPTRNYTAEVELDDAGGSQYVELGFMQVTTTLPANYTSEYRNYTQIPAINSDNNTNPFFSDPSSAWSIYTPDFNNSANLNFPSIYANDNSRYGPSLLSTDQVDAPLRFTVPNFTSLMQWHGTVSPNQGRYELRLLPQSPLTDFQHQLVYNYTAQSTVSAIEEMKAITPLDPRISYRAEIRLLESGKRADLHGVSFIRFTDNADGITQWWNSEYPSSGLSGGQIAGIVIGSVAGAALIAALVWFLIRRNKRNHAKAQDFGRKASTAPTEASSV